MTQYYVVKANCVIRLTVTQQDGHTVVEEHRIVASNKLPKMDDMKAIRKHLKLRRKWKGTLDVLQ